MAVLGGFEPTDLSLRRRLLYPLSYRTKQKQAPAGLSYLDVRWGLGRVPLPTGLDRLRGQDGAVRR